MRRPLVSIIIPTANRPNFLPRAVESALGGMQPDEIEVIVVPNGPDESWKESLTAYRNNPSVRIIPISGANANVARNTGLAAVRGQYIRFLDDDDYLIPDGAKKQYHLIESSDVDVVCGSIKVVSPNGEALKYFESPGCDDFCEAIITHPGFYLPHAFLYRNSSVSGISWNPSIKNRQDFYWLLDVCKAKELKWMRLDEVVGIWQHHWGTRITLHDNIDKSNRAIAQALIRLFRTFQRENRLSEVRRTLIEQALWNCIHASFVFDPAYWTGIVKEVYRIDRGSRPIQPIYNWTITKNIDPLILQWLLYPVRRLRYLDRTWNLKRHSDNFW